MNMQSLMAQAQKMQKEITSKKEELNKEIFNGNSELVDVTVNGKKEVLTINIKDKEKLSADDMEVLEDMILIAINDAFSKVDKATEAAMGNYGSALNGLF